MISRDGKDGTPAWAYGEDGYCVCCGNGRWKYHMPECQLRDALKVVKHVRHLGLMMRGNALIIHAGPYEIDAYYCKTPYAARVFEAREEAVIDIEAARLAIAELDELLAVNYEESTS